MAMNFDFSPLADVIDALTGNASAADLACEAAVAVGGIAIAWFVARSTCRRVTVNPKWQFGKGHFERVASRAALLVWRKGAPRRARSRRAGVCFWNGRGVARGRAWG